MGWGVLHAQRVDCTAARAEERPIRLQRSPQRGGDLSKMETIFRKRGVAIAVAAIAVARNRDSG
jgi:hypothetical protein